MIAEVGAVLLTVSSGDEAVEITFDREGLDHLIRSLTSLQGRRLPTTITS
jgi:hypothetical protein